MPLQAGGRYWLEIICSRSEEYTGYGSPEVDLEAATSGQDGYRMGRCDVGVRVHSPASKLPNGNVKGAAFEIHQVVILSSHDSANGFVELSFDGCAQWVSINTTTYDLKPPPSSDVEAAVQKLIPTSPLVQVVRVKLNDDAYLYNVTIKAAGTHGDMRVRSAGIEWTGYRARVGGIDVLPITGDMLVAPSLKRRPTVTVRLSNQTNAACGTADWEARKIGCFLRYQPRFTTSYDNPDDILRVNHSALSVGGMTLERCSMHCEKYGHAYFAVSPVSGITQECGCLDEVDTDDQDKFEMVPKSRCSAECTSDGEQLCGGRSVSLGERYANVYKCEDPDRSLHYEHDGALAEPQAPCRLDFWNPSYSIIGAAPFHVLAGDTVLALVKGVNESVTPVPRLNTGLSICGHPCTGALSITGEERAAVLANYSSGPWADDLPLGIYDATTLLCRLPECEAGRADVLLFVPEAGFAQPSFVISGLYIASIARVKPITVPLRQADVVLGTPSGGAELEITGGGFSSSPENMRVTLFWNAGEQQTGCTVFASSYSALRCRTLPADDVTLAVGRSVQVNVSLPSSVVPGILFGDPDEVPMATAPTSIPIRFLDYAEAPIVSRVLPNAGSAAGGSSLCIHGLRLTSRSDIAPVVHLGTSPCELTSHNETLICCITGSHPPGVVTLAVQIDGVGNAINVREDDWEYLPPFRPPAPPSPGLPPRAPPTSPPPPPPPALPSPPSLPPNNPPPSPPRAPPLPPAAPPQPPLPPDFPSPLLPPTGPPPIAPSPSKPPKAPPQPRLPPPSPAPSPPPPGVPPPPPDPCPPPSTPPSPFAPPSPPSTASLFKFNVPTECIDSSSFQGGGLTCKDWGARSCMHRGGGCSAREGAGWYYQCAACPSSCSNCPSRCVDDTSLVAAGGKSCSWWQGKCEDYPFDYGQLTRCPLACGVCSVPKTPLWEASGLWSLGSGGRETSGAHYFVSHLASADPPPSHLTYSRPASASCNTVARISFYYWL